MRVNPDGSMRVDSTLIDSACSKTLHALEMLLLSPQGLAMMLKVQGLCHPIGTVLPLHWHCLANTVAQLCQ